VDDTVDSWSCKSISNGARLGAEWWFTSPFDAADRDTWKDAFDFWGNVKPLTGASTGSLDVNTIAAWVTSTILSGSQKINGFYEWYGTNLYKGDGIFGGIHVRWSVFPNNNPGFTVDFNPIVPPG
jgi:hypothetical protein